MVVVEEIEKIEAEVVVQLQRRQEKGLIERGNMNLEIKRIDLEIEAIAILAKKLILEADINLGLLSELIQVTDKRISELAYVKDHILSWDDPEDKIFLLSLSKHEHVFIRSKTDGDWIAVQNIGLIEINQIFAINPNHGEEYKLLSNKVKDDESFIIQVEKIQG